MGKQEEVKSCKPEKPTSPPRPDHTNIHVYPDWAATQAYYGPRVAVPYYNSAVPSGYAPHPYMWGHPQPMIPPYGTPYAATYPHGGVYSHPAVPLTPTPISVETPTKSPGDANHGSTKKLKTLDGLGMSIGNKSSVVAENDSKQRSSESTETEGSSDGSEGNNSGVDQNRRKRGHEGTFLVGDGKAGILDMGHAEGGFASDGTQPRTAGQLKMPSEAWLLSEKELKRERRKQSNRESARRSRLRKQAEAEELANRVGSLTAENMALTSEISRLTEDSEKLRRENALLMEKLKKSQVEGTEEKELNETSDLDDGASLPITTENLLARVNNSGTLQLGAEEEVEEGEDKGYDGNSKSGSKLKQLLDTKPITNAVAAS